MKLLRRAGLDLSPIISHLSTETSKAFQLIYTLHSSTFPAELRNKIFDLASYNGVFELGPHLPTTPNVLLAFAPFKKLYPEIVGHVQAANFVLDDASAVRFQALRNPERGEIRHLTIELSGSVL